MTDDERFEGYREGAKGVTREGRRHLGIDNDN